jgi:glycine betaine/proline transport system ATP-binding protein
MIQLKNIYKIFGKNPQKAFELLKKGKSKDFILSETNHTIGIHNLSLEIPKNTFYVLMGLSGSGKSTLIRHLNGLIQPTSGEVFVDGENILNFNKTQWTNYRRYKISMVFQKFALFPHKTVFENASFGLEIRGETKKNTLPLVMHWIEKVGLRGYENSYPHQLSGGMQQRVGIARALAVNPDILLMDEPFGALDPLIRAEMQETLLELCKDLQKTIIFVTHDLDEAIKLSDKIAILKDGELVQEGTANEIIENPASEYVEKFVEKITSRV